MRASFLRLLVLLTCSSTAHCGVGETKTQIRQRYEKIVFSVRETLDTVLWKSGPLAARLEKEALRVSATKKESAR